MRATELFVTLSDAFSMEYTTMSKFQPYFADIDRHLSHLTDMPPDHLAKATIKKW